MAIRWDKFTVKAQEAVKRANELATTRAKSMLLETEFEAMRRRLALPPALPYEPYILTEP